MTRLLLEPEGRASFNCPGCGMVHTVVVSGPRAWQWNGDVDRVTLSPSVLFASGHYAQGWQGPNCWCTYNKEHPEQAADGFSCVRCHSFVREGKIQFLNDCSHALAGQTVDLPEVNQ